MSDEIKETPKQPALCPTCGTRVAPNASRCVVCGTEFADDGSGSKERGSAQITLSVPLAMGLLAVFALLAAGLTYGFTRVLGVGGDGEEVDATITETATITNTPEPTFTETPEPTFTPLPDIEYTIQASDTCNGIAIRYNISLQALLQANPGMVCELLSVGQTIMVPQPTPTASPQPTATLSEAEQTIAACDIITYEVEANDTLDFIARNYNVDMAAIMDYNNMGSEVVFIGQVLRIPLCERLPTAGPTPTATAPPPYPAPNLLLPQDGAAFTLANDTVTLQWASVGELRDNESYQVTIVDVTEGSGTVRLLDYVTDTKYIVPTTFRPNDTLPHIMSWRVQVVRQTGVDEDGEPIYEVGGSVSLPRYFTWSGAAVDATPTP